MTEVEQIPWVKRLWKYLRLEPAVASPAPLVVFTESMTETESVVIKRLYRWKRFAIEWDSEEFHRTCDGKGTTILQQSRLYEFTNGGYSSESWKVGLAS